MNNKHTSKTHIFDCDFEISHDYHVIKQDFKNDTFTDLKGAKIEKINIGNRIRYYE